MKATTTSNRQPEPTTTPAKPFKCMCAECPEVIFAVAAIVVGLLFLISKF